MILQIEVKKNSINSIDIKFLGTLFLMYAGADAWFLARNACS